jgi:hypothetical protein
MDESSKLFPGSMDAEFDAHAIKMQKTSNFIKILQHEIKQKNIYCCSVLH